MLEWEQKHIKISSPFVDDFVLEDWVAVSADHKYRLIDGEEGWSVIVDGEHYAFTDSLAEAKAKAERIEAGPTDAQLEALGVGPIITE